MEAPDHGQALEPIGDPHLFQPPRTTAEDRLLEWLARRPCDHPLLAVGIGDDAAAFRADGRWIAAADAVVEGVHFTVPPATWRDVGFKAMARNLSDAAAMGSKPELALDTLSVGPGLSDEDVREIVLGLEDAARPFGTALCGGDVTSSPGPTVVSVTILGRDVCGRVLTRSGARAGDEVWATGAFGGSILGRHLRPTARVEFALAANATLPLTAAIDVSDGLAKDLSRLVRSSGVGVRLESAAIPIHPDARRLAATSGRDPLEHALGDGEDFELLVTVVPGYEAQVLEVAERTGTPVARIGRITESAFELVHPGGGVEALPALGFGHEWAR